MAILTDHDSSKLSDVLTDREYNADLIKTDVKLKLESLDKILIIER